MSGKESSARREIAVATPPSTWDKSTLRGLAAIIREDLKINGSPLIPGSQMLMHYRLGQWVEDPSRTKIGAALGLLAWRVLFPYVRNVLGFEVPRTVVIGRRVKFVHQHGVTIHPEAQIGDDCMVLHNVTIGRRLDERIPGPFPPKPPRVGAHVVLGVGATIIGGVTIGDHAIVGALTVVAHDVPAAATVVAVPPRVLRLRTMDSPAASSEPESSTTNGR